MSRIRMAALLVAGLALTATAAFAQGPLGPPHGVIYAHDVAYRTVATPRDLPNHGMFDTIYLMGEGLDNVSESAPGDQDFNGGRWEVRPITWNVMPVQYTNAEDILAAADRGDLVIGDVVKRFECPLIRAD